MPDADGMRIKKSKKKNKKKNRKQTMQEANPESPTVIPNGPKARLATMASLIR
jgi:hypothetical protein